MSQETYQLAGNAAEIYESQKVPAMFGPLADATLNEVSLAPDDAVLDIACGTGILARKARSRVGEKARVAGIDLNDSMIATAQGLRDSYAQSCEWHVSPVDAMPFEDSAFSKVFCQQGFQFFPDESAALREMRRVMRSGGLLAMTIWSGPAVLFTVMAEGIARSMDRDTADKLLLPFTYAGHDQLQTRMSQAGFIDVARKGLPIDRVVRDADCTMEQEILGNPVGSVVAAKGEQTMKAIIDHTLDGMSEYRVGADLVFPQDSFLYLGRAG